MYSLFAFAVGFLGYSYYNNIKTIFVNVLYSYTMKTKAIDINASVDIMDEVNNAEYDVTEYTYTKDGSSFSILNKWPPIDENKKSFITIYLNSVNVSDVFKKYAGPSKNFYDGKIYLKYILRDQEYQEDAELKIIDNTGKFHVIYLEKYGPSEYYEFI